MKLKSYIVITSLLLIVLVFGIITGGFIHEKVRRDHKINFYRALFLPKAGGAEWRAKQPNRKTVPSKPNLQDEIKKLESLGYLSGSELSTGNQNVIFYNKEKAYNGLNLWVTGNALEAYLMDMDGKIVHTWNLNLSEVWPTFENKMIDIVDKHLTYYFRRAHLFENGDLLVIIEGKGMVKINKDSEVIWEAQNKAHHDFFIHDNNQIYVLTRTAHIVKEVRSDKPILEDSISVLDEAGNEIKKVSLLKMFYNSDYASLLKSFQLEKNEQDIFHTNTIEMLDGTGSDKADWLRKGNLLISIWNLSMVCVVNFEEERVVWAQVGFWHKQHEPVLLDNGNILMFDNQGISKNNARVIEYDPLTLAVKWNYAGTRETPLDSGLLGACARLKNGNTLISETEHGRVIEVTPDKKIVWEFINPNKIGDNDEFVAYIPELIRLEPDFPTDWLEN